jgi:hypothetical protein
MRHLILPALFALSACQTTQPGIEVREVEVPVPVRCVDPADVPAEPPRIGDELTGNAVVDLSIVAASALELRKWGQEMAALLRGCGG